MRLNNVFKYENNDMPNSNIAFIITVPAPKLHQKTLMIVHYKDLPSRQFRGKDIVEAIKEFSDEKNGGINRLISLDLERNVKESLSEFFALYASGGISLIEPCSVIAPYNNGFMEPYNNGFIDVLRKNPGNRLNIRDLIAEEIIKSLSFMGCKLHKKMVLDVGPRTGENAKKMAFLGADVYAVEPDIESLNQAIELGNIKEHKAFPVTLQDLPASLNGTFDIVTCFLWCIKYKESETFIRSLGKLTKEYGEVIIGVNDDAFVQGELDIEPLLNRYFYSVKSFRSNGYNKYLFNCFFPRDVPIQPSAISPKYINTNAIGDMRIHVSHDTLCYKIPDLLDKKMEFQVLEPEGSSLFSEEEFEKLSKLLGQERLALIKQRFKGINKPSSDTETQSSPSKPKTWQEILTYELHRYGDLSI